MCKRNFVNLLIGAAVLVWLFPGTAAANDVIAEVDAEGDTIRFHPVVEYRELILTITGPCNFVHRQVTDRHEDLYFSTGEETIDGVYTYGLVAIPDVHPDIIEVLMEARRSGDNSEVNALCREGELPGPPAMQSAGFTISRGDIIYDPDSHEGKARHSSAPSASEYVANPAGDKGNKDHVINDDLIVDGSACIGFDCVNGESFGFDTIRVKENNLRIKFDDTSTAASYPRNDWQLTANDSANGGASKFSIDDITGAKTPFTLEANAPSHSLFVDDSGRIGAGTSTPSVEIHSVDGDTPTLRLQQDGSSGFAAQTWDVAGNETNFFIRDVTNGSTLPFRIQPDAPSNTLTLRATGYVGIGTWSPETMLHLEDDGPTAVTLNNTAQASWKFNSSNNGTFRISDLDAVAVTEFSLEQDGDLTIAGTLTTAGATYPDYVFEPEYDLMPLADVATFIKENKHLPRVPSAMDVDGGRKINMTELQISLLEKVEELTLYTLAQQQTIEELTARLAALEQDYSAQ